MNTDVKSTQHICDLPIIKKLGEGTYNIVYEVKDGDTKKALITPKRDIKTVNYDIMSSLRHPHLVALDAILASKDCPKGIGVVTSIADGNLGDFIFDNNEMKITLLFKIFSAVHFMHNMKYLHLDISINNILIKVYNSQEGGIIGIEPLVSDFDFTLKVADVNKGTHINKLVAAPQFRAIELFKGNTYVSAATDVWSLGMVALYMFTDFLIPSAREIDEDKHYVKYIEENLTADKIRNKLAESKADILIYDLVLGMLHFDPSQRITLKDVFALPLFKGRKPIHGDFIEVKDDSTVAVAGSILRLYEDTYKLLHPINSFGYKRMLSPHSPEAKAKLNIIFLAADLIYRSTIIAKTDEEILAQTAACQLIAWKYYEVQTGGSISSKAFADLRGISDKAVEEMEIKIILHLRGCIYRSHIYEKINSASALRRALVEILPYVQRYNSIPNIIDDQGPSKNDVLLTEIFNKVLIVR